MRAALFTGGTSTTSAPVRRYQTSGTGNTVTFDDPGSGTRDRLIYIYRSTATPSPADPRNIVQEGRAALSQVLQSQTLRTMRLRVPLSVLLALDEGDYLAQTVDLP